MKKRIASILLVLLLVFLTGCGAKGDAETAFGAMMDTFKTGDAEVIKPYYDFHQESQFVNPDVSAEMLQVVLDTMKEMEYQVESVEKIDGANVKITAQVTTLDFSQVINLYIERLLTLVADEEYQAQVAGMSQADYQKLLADQMAEILTAEEIAAEEKTVSVTMVKQDDAWVPGGDKDAFFGALFGNLINAVNSLI